MSMRLAEISTTVRNYLRLQLVRLTFLLGGRIAPDAIAARAARLFTTPFASSRARANAAPTLGAREEDLGIDGIAIHTYVWGDPALQPYVLFAHGWSSHGTRVARWLQPLRDAGYAVVTFDQAGHETPVAGAGIIAKIPGDLGLAADARPVDEIEPDVVGDHGADGVEIARIEMRDIGGELRPLGVRKGRLQRLLRFGRDLAQPRAAAMQRGFYGRQAGLHDVADFAQGAAEHIGQDHAGALRLR